MKSILLIAIMVILMGCIDRQETVTPSETQTNILTPIQTPTPTENVPVFIFFIEDFMKLLEEHAKFNQVVIKDGR